MNTITPKSVTQEFEMLSSQSVAVLLECSVRTVFRLVAAGKLPQPSVRVGRKFVRWDGGTLRRWLSGLGCQTCPEGSPPGADLPLPDDLIDARQAAALLGVAPSAVYACRHRGSLGSYGVGDRPRFRRSEVEALLPHFAPKKGAAA